MHGEEQGTDTGDWGFFFLFFGRESRWGILEKLTGWRRRKKRMTLARDTAYYRFKHFLSIYLFSFALPITFSKINL
jgi:hypothetical protein